MAVLGVHAALSFNRCVSHDVQHQLALQIAKLSRQCTALVLRNFLDNTKALIPIKLDLNGKVDWDEGLPSNNELRKQQMCLQNALSPTHGQPHESTPANIMHIMVCPACKQHNTAKKYGRPL